MLTNIDTLDYTIAGLTMFGVVLVAFIANFFVPCRNRFRVLLLVAFICALAGYLVVRLVPVHSIPWLADELVSKVPLALAVLGDFVTVIISRRKFASGIK